MDSVGKRAAEWHITLNEVDENGKTTAVRHTVTYLYIPLSGKIQIGIDGADFVLPAGLPGSSRRRDEFFFIGDSRGTFRIDGMGRAVLLIDAEPVTPVSAEVFADISLPGKQTK